MDKEGGLTGNIMEEEGDQTIQHTIRRARSDNQGEVLDI